MSRTLKPSSLTAPHVQLITAFMAVLVLAGVAGNASAQDSQVQDSQWSNGGLFRLHGFGSWIFGMTDGNRYLLGNEAGDYENADLSLNLTVTPAWRLKVVSQIQLREEQESVDFEVDYTFVEWRFLNPLRVRAGRVKHPFGIYTEVFDVGTLRPFLILPQGIYGPQGFTAQTYNGLGLSGDASAWAGWDISYDLYAGQIEALLERPPFSSADDVPAVDGKISREFRINDVLGGRINLLKPYVGLMVGLSAYRGHTGFSQEEGREVGYLVYGIHGEYMNERWWIRSEYAELEQEATARGTGAYMELAYRLSRRWQAALRYDRWDLRLAGFSRLPPVLRAISSHEDWGLALNYWLSASIVFKLNLHLVDGNRFAFPEDPQTIVDVLMGREFSGETRLIMFGAQLSF